MSDENTTIQEVNFGDKDKLIGQLEKMRRDLPYYLEMSKLVAQIKKANYDAYVEQGFTEEQAMELIK